MNLEHWTAVDRYFSDNLVASDSVLDAALAASVAAGLPAINVAANQGKLLHLLVRIHGARTVLEIGTLGGYSTIWLARGLPEGGRLTTLELDPKHADVARGNFARAGLDKIIDLRVGPAIDALPRLAAEGRGPFDFIFIDADKVSIHDYFQWALKLARSGSVIVVDNVVRNGAVVDASSSDASVQGVRRFIASLRGDSRVSATTLQTVGSKGYDGLMLAVVK